MSSDKIDFVEFTERRHDAAMRIARIALELEQPAANLVGRFPSYPQQVIDCARELVAQYEGDRANRELAAQYEGDRANQEPPSTAGVPSLVP